MELPVLYALERVTWFTHLVVHKLYGPVMGLTACPSEENSGRIILSGDERYR